MGGEYLAKAKAKAQEKRLASCFKFTVRERVTRKRPMGKQERDKANIEEIIFKCNICMIRVDMLFVLLVCDIALICLNLLAFCKQYLHSANKLQQNRTKQ